MFNHINDDGNDKEACPPCPSSCCMLTTTKPRRSKFPIMVMGTMFLTIAIVNAFLDDQDTKAKGEKEETKKQWYRRKGKRGGGGRGGDGTIKTRAFL